MSSSSIQHQDRGLLSQNRRRKKRSTNSASTAVSSVVLAIVMGALVSLILLLDARLSGGAKRPAHSASHRKLQNDVSGDGDDAHPIKEPVLCSAELNLYCPAMMKCCHVYAANESSVTNNEVSAVSRKLPFLESRTVVGYNCLAASKGKYPIGDCCSDGVGDSGCSIGYSCAAAVSGDAIEEGDELSKISHCQLDASKKPLDNNGKPIEFTFKRMPRYHTCSARSYESYQPFGLPIPKSAGQYNGRAIKSGFLKEEHIGQLAYYTNGNSLDVKDEKVKTAVVTIHGSGRDSANYHCYMMRAVSDYVSSVTKARQVELTAELVSEDDYLVIAPWFLAPQDGDPESASSLPYLKWDDNKPIEHTFRYGSESLPANGNTVSSFAAMDVLLESLCSKQSYPNLKKIVVTGHSAGGQFVHRWGISSDSWCLDSNENHPHVKLVAANPRSYAYLDARRYFPSQTDKYVAQNPTFVVDKRSGDGDDTVFEFRELTSQEKEDCPVYNRYEWGLNDNSELPAPYVMSNLAPFQDVTDSEVFCRYASRDVVYLSGERDVEKLGNQICNEDGYQGPTRKQRSERFYGSLQVLGKETGYCGRDDGDEKVHNRVVVKNVGHDHALIYDLDEGQRVLFD
ncbi:hypothetical protein ACHAWO_005050 [Cyclotella atomus]|uniref:Uncharacterized protein n=1 Tax=Cyclotella atomus TaxID=382360 RepID=A0ABD3P9M0_9STRA